MDGYLKASTSQYVLVGPYVSTDGLTGKANLKISVGAFQIGKNGAAFANKTHTAIAASSGTGWYRVPLSITDVNTPGNLQYKSSISAAVKVFGAYTILPKTIYSGWFGAGYLPVNAVQIEGVDATNQLSTSIGATRVKINTNGLSAGSVVTGTLTNAKFATGALSGGTLAANAKSSIGTAVWLTAARVITSMAVGGKATVAAGVKSLGVNYASSVGLVKKAAANVLSAAVFATGAFTNAKFATGALSGGALAANAKSSVGTAVWLTTTRNITSMAAGAANATGTAAKTSIGTGATLTAIPWNTAWGAKVASSMFAVSTGLSYGVAAATSVVLQTADNAGGSALTESGIATAVAKALFTTATTMSYGDAVAGSPVKEIADNAGGSALTESGIAAAVRSLGVNYVSSTGLVKKASSNVLSAAVIATGAFTGVKFAANVLSAGNLVSGIITNSKLATGAFSGGTFTTNAKSSIGTAVWLNTARVITSMAAGGANAAGTAAKTSIGTGSTLTAIPWNATWDAQVESEVDDALGGGTGTALLSIPWNSNWDAEVQSEVADALAVYDPPTKAELDTAQAAVKVAANGLSAAGIVTGAFTNAKFATGALSGGTLTAGAKGSIGTATWATTTRQLTGTQTFNLTGNVTGNVVGNVTGSVGTVVVFKPNAISAPVIATGAITNAKVAASAFSTGHFKSTAIPGQVAPPAAAGLPTQVSYIYKFMRNQVVVDSTAGTVSVYDDSGVTVDHIASITDASGTFTRTEFKAGT